MSDPLSLADLFIVGVAFDLLGGWYLGRGLLAKPRDIARRTATLVGGNPQVAVSQIEAGADARVGLFSLGIGFLFQAGGYLAEVAGASVATGAVRAVVAVAIAVAATAGAVGCSRRPRRRAVRSLATQVARMDWATGDLADLPDHNMLVSLAEALGFSAAGVETRNGPSATNAGGPAA